MESRSRRRIHEIKLIHFEQDIATIFVHCSSGTYVRSIARDLGMRFDCGAHVHELTRTKFNNFTVQESCDPDGPPGDLKASFIPMERLLEQFPKVTLDETQSARILNGSTIRLEDTVTDLRDANPLMSFFPPLKWRAIARRPSGARFADFG